MLPPLWAREASSPRTTFPIFGLRVPRRCQDVPGRPFGFISLFFCGAFPRQRSGGPCCRRSLASEPDSHGMSLVAGGSPDGAADLAHSLFLLRPSRFCARRFQRQTPPPCRRGLAKMHTGCWWCRPGRNSDELLTFLAHAPPQRRCRNMFSSFLWDTNVQSRSRRGPYSRSLTWREFHSVGPLVAMGELAQKKSVCAGAKQEILTSVHHCDRLETSRSVRQLKGNGALKGVHGSGWHTLLHPKITDVHSSLDEIK